MRTLKKTLCFVLAVVMILGLGAFSVSAKTTDDYSDADEIKNAEAVDVLGTLGVLDGFDTGDFQPEGTLTRAQAAKMITTMLGITNLIAKAQFEDVPEDFWASGPIAYCANEGIVAGINPEHTLFDPNGELTAEAFAKMLLTAIGYDATMEGMVDTPSWEINIAKLIRASGLNKGLEDVDLTDKPITRDDAAQMALNALKTPLVTYDSTTSVNINGANVVISNSNAKYITNNSTAKQTIANTKEVNTGNYLVEFAEQYFPKLVLADKGTDGFERPSNKWTFDGKKIGTYAKAADLTYTGAVKTGKVYSDLGLSETLSKLYIYTDGIEQTHTLKLVRGGDSNIKNSGRSVLTEVYYDKDEGTVTICETNTWAGSIARSVAATSAKDAHVVVSAGDNEVPTHFAGNNEFETDEKFEDDDVVYYTFSEKDEEITSVAKAEAVTGKVNQTQNKTEDGVATQNVTIEGEVKYAGAKFDGEEVRNIIVGGEYTAYLDNYGNMIKLEEVEALSGNYALVMALESASDADFTTNRAKLLCSDGVIRVVTTERDYKNGSVKVGVGKIVTYRSNDNVYTLKEVSKTYVQEDATSTAALSLTNGKAGIKIASDTIYSNSKSIFVVYNQKSGDVDVYTGVKTAPTIEPAEDATASGYAYCKSGTMTTVMFVVVENEDAITDSGYQGLFLSTRGVSNLIGDGKDSYFIYHAVVDGEVKDVQVDGSLGAKLGGIYKTYSTNSRGVVTVVNSASNHGYDAFSDGDDGEYLAGTGIEKRSGEYTVTIATANTWTVSNGNVSTSTNGAANSVRLTVANDAKLYYVDSSNKINEIKYDDIQPDPNDKVFAFIDDYYVKALYIEYVAPGVTDNDGGQDEGEYVKASLTNVDDEGRWTIQVSSSKPLYATDNATMTATINLTENGYVVGTVDVSGIKTDGSVKTVSWSRGDYQFQDGTVPGIEVASEAATQVKVRYIDVVKTTAAGYNSTGAKANWIDVDSSLIKGGTEASPTNGGYTTYLVTSADGSAHTSQNIDFVYITTDASSTNDLTVVVGGGSWNDNTYVNSATPGTNSTKNRVYTNSNTLKTTPDGTDYVYVFVDASSLVAQYTVSLATTKANATADTPTVITTAPAAQDMGALTSYMESGDASAYDATAGAYIAQLAMSRNAVKETDASQDVTITMTIKDNSNHLIAAAAPIRVNVANTANSDVLHFVYVNDNTNVPAAQTVTIAADTIFYIDSIDVLQTATVKSIKLVDANNSGTYNAGDRMEITFSKAMSEETDYVASDSGTLAFTSHNATTAPWTWSENGTKLSIPIATPSAASDNIMITVASLIDADGYLMLPTGHATNYKITWTGGLADGDPLTTAGATLYTAPTT